MEEIERDREEVVLDNLDLVGLVARRMAGNLPSNVEVGDLINAGAIGLMDAVEKFDPSREIKFKTYAEFRIRGAILDELRSEDWLPRSVRRKSNFLINTYDRTEQELGRPAEDEEMARAMGMDLGKFQTLLNEVGDISFKSLEKMDEDEESECIFFSEEMRIYAQQIKKILSQAIDELSPKERTVISLYYHEELVMKEIGEVMGVIESRISQLHTKAIFRLRQKLKNKGLEGEVV